MSGKEASALRQILAIQKRINIGPVYFIGPILLSLLTAGMEGISMGLLIPMLNGFLTKDFSFLKQTTGFKELLPLLPLSITTSDRLLFGVLLGTFFGVIVVKNILRYVSVTSIIFLITRSHHHLRKYLFTRYLSFGKLFFDRTGIGHHAAVFNDFLYASLRPLVTIDSAVNAIFSLVVYLIIMFFISWKLTLISIPLFLVLHFMLKRVIGSMHHLSRSIARSTSALSQKTVDILSSISLVKSYNAEEKEKRQYTKISYDKAQLDFRIAMVEQLIRPLQEVSVLVAMLILFAIMTYLLVRDNTVAAPAFIVYFYLVFTASNKFNALSGFRGALANSTGALAELGDALSDEGKFFVPDGTKKFEHLSKEIEFRRLSFSYPDGKQVLHDLTFTVPKGQMTALVGPTGVGKTTIVNLLLRFYDCPPGTIFVDGTDIREYSGALLRSHMALVSQETLLLHDTLRHNIAYGVDAVTEEQIQDVLRRSRLSDLIADLPQGLDTLVGDKGVKLSGGEKQRVSIARALLKGAEILLLDEATSALDSRTEKLIQEAIDDASKGKTAIVIAHRLSTIQHADNIVVIENGVVAEQGGLQELLAKKGRFHEYWEQQMFV